MILCDHCGERVGVHPFTWSIHPTDPKRLDAKTNASVFGKQAGVDLCLPCHQKFVTAVGLLCMRKT